MPDLSNGSPEFEPLIVERTPSAGAGRRPVRHRRALVVAATLSVAGASAVVVAATVADTAPANDPANDPASDPASVAPVTGTLDEGPTADVGAISVPPVGTLAPVVSSHPIGWSVVDVRDQISGLRPSDADQGWTEWSIPVPDLLAEMTSPSTVVASAADGALHRIEFPSGRISSRLLPPSGRTGQIAVAGDSVAVPRRGGVVIVGGDGSLLDRDLETDRVPRVSSFGSRFVVTADGEVGGRERRWILDPEGSLIDITDGAFARFAAWDLQFSPSGELLANDRDDIVVVDVDGGVRRIDRGGLVAVGSRHYVLRICGRRTCDHTIVDLSTGRRTTASLGVLDAYRYFDTSIRISPDGRFVVFADWRRSRPLLRIIDVADGTTIDAGELRDVRTPDAWASDSSGVFVSGDDGVVFRSMDGQVAVIAGLGPVRSVATRAGG